MNLCFIETRDGRSYPRWAWTGGDTPERGDRRVRPLYRQLVSAFFRESLRECGGLDLWKCAGTGSLERARIFWNQARLDGWRTYCEFKDSSMKSAAPKTRVGRRR